MDIFSTVTAAPLDSQVLPPGVQPTLDRKSVESAYLEAVDPRAN